MVFEKKSDSDLEKENSDTNEENVGSFQVIYRTFTTSAMSMRKRLRFEFKRPGTFSWLIYMFCMFLNY